MKIVIADSIAAIESIPCCTK